MTVTPDLNRTTIAQRLRKERGWTTDHIAAANAALQDPYGGLDAYRQIHGGSVAWLMPGHISIPHAIALAYDEHNLYQLLDVADYPLGGWQDYEFPEGLDMEVEAHFQRQPLDFGFHATPGVMFRFDDGEGHEVIAESRQFGCSTWPQIIECTFPRLSPKVNTSCPECHGDSRGVLLFTSWSPCSLCNPIDVEF